VVKEPMYPVPLGERTHQYHAVHAYVCHGRRYAMRNASKMLRVTVAEDGHGDWGGFVINRTYPVTRTVPLPPAILGSSRLGSSGGWVAWQREAGGARDDDSESASINDRASERTKRRERAWCVHDQRGDSRY